MVILNGPECCLFHRSSYFIGEFVGFVIPPRMHLQMIGRSDWAKIEEIAVIFENYGPAIETGVITAAFGVEKRYTITGLRLLAPYCLADIPRPALVLPDLDSESLRLPIPLTDLIKPIAQCGSPHRNLSR